MIVSGYGRGNSYLTNSTVMVAENISLGILSLPSAVATLGIIP